MDGTGDPSHNEETLNQHHTQATQVVPCQRETRIVNLEDADLALDHGARNRSVRPGVGTPVNPKATSRR